MENIMNALKEVGTTIGFINESKNGKKYFVEVSASSTEAAVRLAPYQGRDGKTVPGKLIIKESAVVSGYIIKSERNGKTRQIIVREADIFEFNGFKYYSGSNGKPYSVPNNAKKILCMRLDNGNVVEVAEDNIKVDVVKYTSKDENKKEITITKILEFGSLKKATKYVDHENRTYYTNVREASSRH